MGEKALKGFLFAGGAEVVLGHSIERLCAEAGERQPAFQERARRTRYPNSLPDSIPARVFTEEAAREAVRLAAEIVQYVRGLLGAQPPRA